MRHQFVLLGLESVAASVGAPTRRAKAPADQIATDPMRNETTKKGTERGPLNTLNPRSIDGTARMLIQPIKDRKIALEGST